MASYGEPTYDFFRYASDIYADGCIKIVLNQQGTHFDAWFSLFLHQNCQNDSFQQKSTYFYMDESVILGTSQETLVS